MSPPPHHVDHRAAAQASLLAHMAGWSVTANHLLFEGIFAEVPDPVDRARPGLRGEALEALLGEIGGGPPLAALAGSFVKSFYELATFFVVLFCTAYLLVLGVKMVRALALRCVCMSAELLVCFMVGFVSCDCDSEWPLNTTRHSSQQSLRIFCFSRLIF